MERPKRRKKKDNPYILLIDDNKYYILFKDVRGVLNKIEVNELGIRNRHDYCGKEHHAENCFQTQNIQRTYAVERKVQQPVRTAHTRSEASWKVDDR